MSQLASIQWLGRRGMQWASLLPTLLHHRVFHVPPQVLLDHLGGNDLGLLKGKALILQALADFQSLRRRWPGVLIIWSCMLPRLVWREGSDHLALEQARRRANSETYKELLRYGDMSIQHPEIVRSRRALYRQDGVHLSDQGNDLFLEDLQKGLRDAILARWERARKQRLITLFGG